MKSTGMVRRMDELGRVVVPIELRRTLNINEKDPVEIFVDEDRIVLRKYQPGCVFCGDADIKLVGLHDKMVCQSCVKDLKTASGQWGRMTK